MRPTEIASRELPSGTSLYDAAITTQTVSADKPDWWIANEEAKAAMNLPDYEPPRFRDGVYVHEVVPSLERKYDCEIKFLGINVDYLDKWEVRIDDEPRITIDRSRDERGNTVYGIESDEFARRLDEAIESTD